MIDPGTGLTILGSAVGGAKIIEKILGPSSDYIGEQLREWTKKKVINISNIFKNAETKLGNKLNEEGSVPPKVLKEILENGAWSEEGIQVEYFGGVLASSRTGISRDDRGAYFTSLISRLSTYQLRTHYFFYHSIRNHFSGRNMNVGSQDDRRNMELFVPFDSYVKAMDFVGEEQWRSWDLMSHSIWGLSKEELIQDNFHFGPADFIKAKFPEANTRGILFQPSNLGTELFLWAYGHGQRHINDFFYEDLVFNNEQRIEIGETVPTKKQNVS